MLANVSATLATAARVLEHLHSALVRAGFVSGMPAYRSMCDLLFGQRLWSLPRADDRLRAQFQDVAAKATAVRDILEPYTDMMRRLSAVGTLDLAPVPRPEPEPARPPQSDGGRIAATLRAHGRPMTVTALAREAGMTRRHAGDLVRGLVTAGAVKAVKAGRRTLYITAGP
jgi:hypothetical protein